MAIKVKLRQKNISKKRKSLYLDFYPAIPHPETGEPTRREFLKMYLFENPKTPFDKQHNRETLHIAEQMRQKRENSLNKPEIYTEHEKERLKLKEIGEQNFVAYFSTLAHKRKASNHDNWLSALNYLNEFTGGELPFAQVNEKWCNEFKEFLLTTKSKRSNKQQLAQNSAVSYFNKLKATLKQAYKDGLLMVNLNARIEPIKQADTKREFLTLEELNRLVKTECKDTLLKRAALFSALTGLRFSDIQKLVWGEVEEDNENGYSIRFQQQKTKGLETLPISRQAFGLMGERGTLADQVFEGLTYSAYYNKHLYQWIRAAGITKNITFHCFRHTYATLLLSKGTDIYTVSKMLGHRDLKTTLIYTKVMDKAKREAANKIQIDTL